MKTPLEVIAGRHTEREWNPRPKGTTESPAIPLLYHLSYRRPSLTKLGLYAPLIIASLALTGCASSAPVIQIERVYTKVYVPVPSTLVAPIAAVLPLGTTWGQGLGIEAAALQTCNANLGAIASLKPPPP